MCVSFVSVDLAPEWLQSLTRFNSLSLVRWNWVLNFWLVLRREVPRILLLLRGVCMKVTALILFCVGTMVGFRISETEEEIAQGAA